MSISCQWKSNKKGASNVSRLTLLVWLLSGSALLVCSDFFCGTGESIAQGSIEWPRISLALKATGFNLPVHIAHAGDASGRLFVVEQRGRIRIIKGGLTLNTAFLDITGRVSCCGERGLLSVALSPDYASKNYFYVNYTDLSGNTVIARYRVTTNSDSADPDSEEIILTINQPFANHNGGQLAFGPDGYLYIGMGDGGSSGDPFNNAQNPGTLLGKMLRIDVESGASPYSIPAGNPYRSSPGFRGEIWALGLRNPWRFSFDRQTGDLYIADVGQNLYEEVDVQPVSSSGGQNYGWNIMEGLHCYNSIICIQSGLTLPVIEYDHSQGCSITGGMVYRGSSYPRMQGIYFYADYCSGRIWGLKHDGVAWRNNLFMDTPYAIASFGEDETGNVYLTDHTNGTIYLITDSDAIMPLPTGRHDFVYPSIPSPQESADPSAARPIGLGPAASGGDTLGLQVGLYQFPGRWIFISAYMHHLLTLTTYTY